VSGWRETSRRAHRRSEGQRGRGQATTGSYSTGHQSRNIAAVTSASPHLAVDDSGEGQVVEDLRAVPPHRDRAVLAEALVVKAVDLGDLTGLVVPPDQGYPVRIADLEEEQPGRFFFSFLKKVISLTRVFLDSGRYLQRQQKQECLDAVEASVHEVAHEEVICLGDVATDLTREGNRDHVVKECSQGPGSSSRTWIKQLDLDQAAGPGSSSWTWIKLLDLDQAAGPGSSWTWIKQDLDQARP